MPTITIDCRTKEQKKAERKAKVNKALDQTARWIEGHREELIFGATILTGVAGFGFRVAKDIRHDSQIRRERKERDLYVYDRSLDIWWKLRKPMTRSQKIDLDVRMASGERKGDILRSMKLI